MSPVLDSVLGATGGVSRAFYILHAGRWLGVGATVEQSGEALGDESLFKGSNSTAAGLRHFPSRHSPVRVAQQRETSGESSLEVMRHDLPKTLESSSSPAWSRRLGKERGV